MRRSIESKERETYTAPRSAGASRRTKIDSPETDMAFPLTSGAQRALRTADRLATENDSAVVEPAHLLWALVLAESRAADILARHGLSPSLLEQIFPLNRSFPVIRSDPAFEEADHESQRAARSERSASTDANGEAELPLSEDVRLALRAAQQWPQQSEAGGELGSEHLLWGLLSNVESLRSRLGEHGVPAEELTRQIVEAAQGNHEPLPAQISLVWQEGEETDHHDALRIVDAASNRVREGLRVLEDYVRFVLDDAHLTRRLKTWRHEFSQCLARVNSTALLATRETQQDVGTQISTRFEMSRGTLTDVVRANFKRLEEAARTLEEYGKLLSEELAARMAQLRYELYTLEKAVLLTHGARERLEGRDLYLIVSESLCPHGMGPAVREALAGGVGIVQLREKTMSDRRLLEQGKLVRKWTMAAGALFIMNDRADLALLSDADGVHVGQDELSVREARRIVGPEKLVGVSTHSLEQARQAVLDGADYIGVGPVFPSTTKAFEAYAGLDFVREVAAEISLPAFAIGGITPANIDEVRHAGATRVAISSALCSTPKPGETARELLARLRAPRGAG